MIEDGPGLRLSASFFSNLVEPLLARRFPDLRYAAARIGLGSEVLGFDTEMSADHDYGPAVQLFVCDEAFPYTAAAILQLLDDELPQAFQGWSIQFPANTRSPSGPSRAGVLWSWHGVEIYTVGAWCDRFLQRRYETDLSWHDWLSYPEQYFLLATGGRVFRDDLGDLAALRERLSYFPRDVWLYKIMVQWGRIAEERAYVGRAGSVGDEIGSNVIAARMVENLMRLALLVERRFAPYPKWIGTAFSRLPCAPDLSPILEHVLAARHWSDRETFLQEACRALAALQARRGVPGASLPLDGTLHSRPFRFIDTLRIADGIRAEIEDDELRGLHEFGAPDQFLSSNFVKAVPELTQATFTALLATAFGKSRRE